MYPMPTTRPSGEHRLAALVGFAAVTLLLTVLFVLFEATFLPLAALLAVLALLPIAARDRSVRETYWRAFAAGVLVACAFLIWLT